MIDTETTPALQGSIVADRDALRALRDDFARIAETPGGALTIVEHPDWILYELESRGSDASPYVVVARDASGTVVGYAPFLLERRTAHIAIGERRIPIYRGPTLRMLGERVVAAPEQRAAVESALAAAIAGDARAKVLRIQETELPNAFADALTEVRHGFSRKEFHLMDQVKWTLKAPDTAQEFLASFSPKRRKSLQSRERQMLKKPGEGTHVRCYDSAERIDEYCALMNEVYAKSWHADSRPIDWQEPARVDLFRKLGEKQQIAGVVLVVGSRPIAYVHSYRLPGRFFIDDIGYDEEFAALGVGSTLVFHAIQTYIERHPRHEIDFGYGDNLYKRVLANAESACGSLYLVRGVFPELCFSAIHPVRWAYRTMRRLRSAPKPVARDGASGED